MMRKTSNHFGVIFSVRAAMPFSQDFYMSTLERNKFLPFNPIVKLIVSFALELQP